MRGKVGKTDAQRRAAGQEIDGRHNDTTRANAAVGNVLTFPTLEKIPKPSVPLPKNGAGIRAYNEWARDLINAGLLTKVSLAYVENFALVQQQIADQAANGRGINAKLIEQRTAALRKLEALNVDTAIVETHTKKSEFAANGFPGRLRDIAEHKARRSG